MKDGAARFLGQGYRSQEGDVSDLSGARVVTTVIVNGVPRTAVEVVAGVNTYRCAPETASWVLAALLIASPRLKHWDSALHNGRGSGKDSPKHRALGRTSSARHIAPMLW